MSLVGKDWVDGSSMTGLWARSGLGGGVVWALTLIAVGCGGVVGWPSSSSTSSKTGWLVGGRKKSAATGPRVNVLLLRGAGH